MFNTVEKEQQVSDLQEVRDRLENQVNRLKEENARLSKKINSSPSLPCLSLDDVRRIELLAENWHKIKLEDLERIL